MLKTNIDYNGEDAQDIANSVISLNGMITLGEMFDGVHAKHYDLIEQLYFTMKWELFDAVGITEEDFKKYMED